MYNLNSNEIHQKITINLENVLLKSSTEFFFYENYFDFRFYSVFLGPLKNNDNSHRKYCSQEINSIFLGANSDSILKLLYRVKFQNQIQCFRFEWSKILYVQTQMPSAEQFNVCAHIALD